MKNSSLAERRIFQIIFNFEKINTINNYNSVILIKDFETLRKPRSIFFAKRRIKMYLRITIIEQRRLSDFSHYALRKNLVFVFLLVLMKW